MTTNGFPHHGILTHQHHYKINALHTEALGKASSKYIILSLNNCTLIIQKMNLELYSAKQVCTYYRPERVASWTEVASAAVRIVARLPSLLLSRPVPRQFSKSEVRYLRRGQTHAFWARPAPKI